MPLHDIQSSFLGGEFAPKLWSRVDIQKYKTGLRKLRNFIPSAQGCVSNRPGTLFKRLISQASKRPRLIPFEFSSNEAYVLSFEEGQIDVLKNGVYQATIVTPYLEADLSDIRYTQSADVIYLVHPDYAPRRLTRTSDTVWTLDLYPYKNGPFMPDNTNIETGDLLYLVPSAITGSITVTTSGTASNLNYFDSDMVGGLFKFRHFVEANQIYDQFTGVDTTIGIKCGGTWRLVTHGTWAATLRLEISRDGGANWSLIKQFHSVSDVNVNTFGSESKELDEAPFLIRINCLAFSSGTVEIDLTSDSFYQEGVVQLTGYTNAQSVTGTVLVELGGATQTLDWAEGSWSNYRGWPHTVCFFQDRLCFGATDSEPQTTWMTQTGVYVDFARSSPLVDSDGITVNLSSRKVNFILNLIPFNNNIFCSTSEGEWTISSTSGGVITPTTVFTKQHGNIGASSVQPVIVGNQILFISSRGTQIRTLGFDFSSDTFSGENIAFISDHLLQGYSIVDMTYQQEPYSILWMVRSDGLLLSLVYNREQEINCLSWHDTDGDFESVCRIPGTTEDEVWFSVNRDGVRMIEKLSPRVSSTAPEDQYYVDAGIVYDGVATTTVTGLSHLEGKAVSVLADGFVLDPKVVSGGLITLDDEASKVSVGLPYNSDLETLNLEFPLPDGTAQGRKNTIARAILRLLDSRGGHVGADVDTLDDEIFTRDNSVALDVPTPLFTGDYSFTLPQTHGDVPAHIFYRQSDPLPVTILSIMPLVDIAKDI